MQSASERGDALPPFSTAVTATPEGTDSALMSDPSERGQLEPGDSALGVTRGWLDREKQGCTSPHLLTGGSAEDSLWACIP